MQAELKLILDKTCSLFNLLDEKAHIMEKANAKGNLSSILKFELVSFLCCLSAADGRMSRVEAKLIRDMFDLEFYPIHIKEFIQEHNIGTKEYYEKVPVSLKLAVDLDNYLIKTDQDLDMGVSEAVIEVFKIFGKAMVVADEKVKAEEQICWSRYITMMTQYVVDVSLIYKKRPDAIPRPGTPIEVSYENSLKHIGRIYTLYVGKINC